jgi:hypothetical protein
VTFEIFAAAAAACCLAWPAFAFDAPGNFLRVPAIAALL